MARVKLRPRDKFHRVVQGMATGRARGAVGLRLGSLPYAFALQACCCYVSRSPSAWTFDRAVERVGHHRNGKWHEKRRRRERVSAGCSCFVDLEE